MLGKLTGTETGAVDDDMAMRAWQLTKSKEISKRVNLCQQGCAQLTHPLTNQLKKFAPFDPKTRQMPPLQPSPPPLPLIYFSTVVLPHPCRAANFNLFHCRATQRDLFRCRGRTGALFGQLLETTSFDQ
jgi:hypothetical protein